MKRTKKLLALVLALMMAFSCMTMPAMAANEEIMRKPVFQCSYCGGDAELVKVGSGEYSESFWLGCTKYSGPHEHTYAYADEELVCLSTQYTCGKIEENREVFSEYRNGAHVYIYKNM